jgi:hypothetical protein
MDFIVLILIILLLPTVYAAIIGAPILNTSKKRIKQIIEAADIKNGDVVYELGSGMGNMALAFSENPNVKTVGFELSPIFYFISSVKKWLLKRGNLEFRMKNFYKADLSDATIIYFYLMPKSIEKIKGKFNKELKLGTKIISFGFPIKEWEAEKIIQGENLPKVYFYKRPLIPISFV